MTLTQAASFTRKIIFVSILLLLLGGSGLIGYKIFTSINNPTLTQEVVPDTKFGILPALNLPIQATSSATISYQLTMGSQGLPNFSKTARVYFIPKPTGVLNREKITDLAKKFKINTSPQIQDTQYIFAEGIKKLTVDPNLGSFSYQKEASSSAKSPVVDEGIKLTQDLKDFLNNLGFLTDDFKNSQTQVSFLKLNDNGITATSISTEANGAEISLWPQDINGLPIITPNFKQSLFFVTLTKSARDLDNYLSINYLFYPIDQTTFSIYPLKTANEAYSALQAGQGVILLTNNKQQVSLTSMYLAYWESDLYGPYLQPVFVFEGENFAAIVPAVTNQYLNQSK